MNMVLYPCFPFMINVLFGSFGFCCICSLGCTPAGVPYASFHAHPHVSLTSSVITHTSSSFTIIPGASTFHSTSVLLKQALVTASPSVHGPGSLSNIPVRRLVFMCSWVLQVYLLPRQPFVKIIILLQAPLVCLHLGPNLTDTWSMSFFWLIKHVLRNSSFFHRNEFHIIKGMLHNKYFFVTQSSAWLWSATVSNLILVTASLL